MNSPPDFRCAACRKDRELCLCGTITPVACPAQLVVYQHPTEVWRPFNTAFLITQKYRDAQLLVRGDPVAEARLAALLEDPQIDAYLLFPSAHAREVSGIPHRRQMYVLLDGSWQQARRMRRRNELLLRLPVVSLVPAQPSVYRVRKQSEAHHLCTAEAAALLVGRLRGLTGPDPALQSLFEDWISRVLAMRGLPPDWQKPSAKKSK
jgi:DTW domain-containing protein YfiP